jgi:dihydropteroate synthase
MESLVMSVNRYTLEFGKRTYIMGILNITPDSFSGDGLSEQPDLLKAALSRAEEFIEAGADILDIGGESTRPGAQEVSTEQELERVLPIIQELRKNGIDTIISIDTYKSRVAQAALEAGANWINDVWGLRADPRMAGVAAQANVQIILMHNRSKPNQVELQKTLGGRYIGVPYGDLIKDVKCELMGSVEIARAVGIADTNIILDPGIGFGKTVEQNLELVNHLDEIKNLGFPVLLGPSRKSFIGYTLNLPPEERVEGTAAVCAVAIVRGADILRVHDVSTIIRVARMTDAIVRGIESSN